jgi:hypothetical protein
MTNVVPEVAFVPSNVISDIDWLWRQCCCCGAGGEDVKDAWTFDVPSWEKSGGVGKSG